MPLGGHRTSALLEVVSIFLVLIAMVVAASSAALDNERRARGRSHVSTPDKCHVPFPNPPIWLHVPKTGTSFRTLLVDHGCPQIWSLVRDTRERVQAQQQTQTPGRRGLWPARSEKGEKLSSEEEAALKANCPMWVLEKMEQLGTIHHRCGNDVHCAHGTVPQKLYFGNPHSLEAQWEERV